MSHSLNLKSFGNVIGELDNVLSTEDIEELVGTVIGFIGERIQGTQELVEALDIESDEIILDLESSDDLSKLIRKHSKQLDD
jgi:hypothetical protein